MADQMREKIELQVGIPATVVFAFNSGKLCSKRWPGAEDTYARQTNDGRILFVDAAEEMRLRKVVRAGQPVILCRERTKAGAQYLTIKTPAPELKGPLAVVNGSIPDTKYSAPQPPSLVADGQPIAPVDAANSAPTDGGLLGRCLVQALDACKVAQAHAAAIGMAMTFDSSDGERMAVSIFIERTRNGSAVEHKPNGVASTYQNGNGARGSNGYASH